MAQSSASSQLAISNQPSLECAISAFLKGRQWIDTFTTPAIEAPAAQLALPDCSGIYLALRGGGGRIVSDVAEFAHARPGNSTNDPQLLRRAVGRALSSALSDSAIQNLPAELRQSVGGDLSVELELAGPLRPLLARNTEQVVDQFEPGMQGLAMRRGQRLSLLFPAQMRRAGSSDNVEGAIARLAAEVGLTAAPLEQLLKKDALTLYRFDTIHLVQDSPSASPRPTHRGLRVIGIEEVNAVSTAHFADAIAQHLMHQRWTGEQPLGLRGDYDPLREISVPLIAPPRDQALAALALLRYAEAPGVNSKLSGSAQGAAAQLLHLLANVLPTEDDPYTDAASCAMIVCAVSELAVGERDEPITAMLERALDPLNRLVSLDDTAINAELGGLSATERGMIALALVRACVINPHAANCDLTRRYIDMLWNTSDEQAIVAHLPWLGWAELELSALAGTPSERSSEIQRVRLALWTQQVKSSTPTYAVGGLDTIAWLDLVGGFRLSAGSKAHIDRPTSQSARPAALLATLLRNEQFTPPAMRSTALQSHRLTMRYLMQLQITEDDAWFLRNSAAAIGGIRRSTWEISQPNAASALALITAAESLHALKQLQPAAADADSPMPGSGQ